MKTITTIAAIAALTTLAACGTAEAPAEAPATEAAANEAAATEVVAPEAEKTGGPCGDGTVLAENEKCK
jgi:predicted small lipoprotein YifL